MARRFWVRFEPGRWLNTTRVLTPEARGILIDCRSLAFETGGALPDDRTKRGAEWLTRSLALRDRRTLHRIVHELLDKAALERLSDGRLAVADDGDDDDGTGAAGRGPDAVPSPVAARSHQVSLLLPVRGGLHPHVPVQKHGGGMWTRIESPNNRATVGQQLADCQAIRREYSNDSNGRSDSVKNSTEDHDVAAAETRCHPRESRSHDEARRDLGSGRRVRRVLSRGIGL